MTYVTFPSEKSVSLRIVIGHAAYSKLPTLKLVLEPKNVITDVLVAEFHVIKDGG